MTFRAYLTLLRPWRTLLLFLCAGLLALILADSMLAPVVRRFYGFAITLPLAAGYFLFGPLQEVMHRSPFPLLPGGRRVLRRWHLGALVFFAAGFLALAITLIPECPVAALVGMIPAGLSCALPLSQLRQIGRHPSQYFYVIAAMAAALPASPHLLAAGQSAPWAMLAAGLGFATACFHFGFSPRLVGNRWRDPYFYCDQSTLQFVGTDILVHAQKEISWRNQQRDHRRGAEWTATTVTDSLPGWMRVVHHARFGNSARDGSLTRLLLSRALLAVALLTAALAYEYFRRWGSLPADTSALPIQVFCRGTFESLRNWNGIKLAPPGVPAPTLPLLLALAPLIGYFAALHAAIATAVPTGLFPLSRSRLTAALFLDFQRTVITVLAGVGLGTTGVILVVGCIAGTPFDPTPLVPLAVLFGFIPAALNGALAGFFLPGAFLRFAASMIAIPGTICLYGTMVFVHPPREITLAGFVFCALSTVAAASLSWLVLQIHYDRSDLTRTGDWLPKLGLGKA